MCIVKVRDIEKTYGETTALEGISFEVQASELFGFIGPDGAGKTTLFRILATLLRPDSGEASVLGHSVNEGYRDIRDRIGYMPGEFSLYPDLSVRENIEFFASVFGTTLDENYGIIEPIYSQLEPYEDRRADALSGGMKQKLALSCALVHEPELLLLDEPTTGVDAVSRREFWDILDKLKNLGIAILASTPYMDEAERCDRVALIDAGQLLIVDAPQEVARSYPKPLFAVESSDTYRLLQVLRTYEFADSVQPFGDSIHYTESRDTPDIEALESYLQSRDIGDVRIERISPVIEDAFMHFMQEESR